MLKQGVSSCACVVSIYPTRRFRWVSLGPGSIAVQNVGWQVLHRPVSVWYRNIQADNVRWDLIDLDSWRDHFTSKSFTMDKQTFISFQITFEKLLYHMQSCVIAQRQTLTMCNHRWLHVASEAVSSHYEQWLRTGIHIVTPNKKTNYDALAYYNAMRTVQRLQNSHLLAQRTAPIVRSFDQDQTSIW